MTVQQSGANSTMSLLIGQAGAAVGIYSILLLVVSFIFIKRKIYHLFLLPFDCVLFKSEAVGSFLTGGSEKSWAKKKHGMRNRIHFYLLMAVAEVYIVLRLLAYILYVIVFSIPLTTIINLAFAIGWLVTNMSLLPVMLMILCWMDTTLSLYKVVASPVVIKLIRVAVYLVLSVVLLLATINGIHLLILEGVYAADPALIKIKQPVAFVSLSSFLLTQILLTATFILIAALALHVVVKNFYDHDAKGGNKDKNARHLLEKLGVGVAGFLLGLVARIITCGFNYADTNLLWVKFLFTVIPDCISMTTLIYVFWPLGWNCCEGRRIIQLLQPIAINDDTSSCSEDKTPRGGEGGNNGAIEEDDDEKTDKIEEEGEAEKDAEKRKSEMELTDSPITISVATPGEADSTVGTPVV